MLALDWGDGQAKEPAHLPVPVEVMQVSWDLDQAQPRTESLSALFTPRSSFFFGVQHPTMAEAGR